MNAKMDIFARNRTLSYMRTNEPESVSVSVHILLSISIYSRKQVMGLHANGGGLDQTA